MKRVIERSNVDAHATNLMRDAILPLQWAVMFAPGDGDSVGRRWSARHTLSRHMKTGLAVSVLALALALLIGKAGGVVQYEATIVRYPFQIDDAEGVILAEAAMIARNANPYVFQPSPAHHFYAGPYTPLYTVINAAVVRFAGPVLIGGRSVQLCATLAVSVWIAGAIARSGRGLVAWLVGLWAALLFLTYHLVAHWAAMVRPDMTAMACNLFGVTLLSGRWNRSDGTGWRDESWPRGRALAILALGAGCFALGWWTKQTYVAVPLAYMLTRLPHRPRMVLLLAGSYIGLIGLSIGVLTHLSGGGFLQKTYFYQSSWSWDAFLFLAKPFAQRYGLLPAFAFLAAVGLCVRQRRVTFAACWFALTALKTLTAGTDGGNHNHFVELLAASTLVMGQGISALVAPTPTQRGDNGDAGDRRALSSRWHIVFPLLGGAAILALTCIAIAEEDGKGSWLAWEYHLPTVAERQGNERALTWLANATGPIYGDNAGLGLLVLTGRVPQVTDPFTLAAEVRMGRWDDSAIVADVVEGRFQYIVLRGDLARMDPKHPPGDLTPGLLGAIHQHYHLVEHGFVWVYAPNT